MRRTATPTNPNRRTARFALLIGMVNSCRGKVRHRQGLQCLDNLCFVWYSQGQRMRVKMISGGFRLLDLV